MRATQTWKSPKTGAAYPCRWTVEVPGEGLRLEVAPVLADQENRSRHIPALFYWEGAVRVLSPAGDPIGQGYVELTGYGTKGRPAI